MVRPEAAVLIRGAGVNIEEFAPAPEPAGPVRVILIARMIREKGVADFVAAARVLKGQAEFVLVGAPDPGNPNTVTEAELRGWEAEGVVTWLGPRRDIAELLRSAHIAVQPSTYREGLAEIRFGGDGIGQAAGGNRYSRLPGSGGGWADRVSWCRRATRWRWPRR